MSVLESANDAELTYAHILCWLLVRLVKRLLGFDCVELSPP